MTKRIVVSGNLGVGKTTLVQKIGEYFNWHTVYESVVDNPYLPDFYADMCSWAFHLQIYFIGCRAKQYLEVAETLKPVIMDRSIYEDANVFAPALCYLGKITKRDYETILQIYNVVKRSLPAPDLLVYLKAPLEVIMQRIRTRGLEFDQKYIDKDYLVLIESYYEKWIEKHILCPVLVLNTDKLDYINDAECLKSVAEQINAKL